MPFRPRNLDNVYGEFFSQGRYYCYKCGERIVFKGYRKIYRSDWNLKGVSHEVWGCPKGHIGIYTAGKRPDGHVCNDIICKCGQWYHIVKNGVVHPVSNGKAIYGDLFVCGKGHQIMRGWVTESRA